MREDKSFYREYPRYSIALLVVLVVLTGGMTLFLGSGAYEQEQRLHSSETVTGEITELSVEVDRAEERDEDDRYIAHVRFEYTYEGTTYESEKLRPTGRTTYDSHAGAQDRVDSYEVGETVTVYVPADDPSAGFLEADRSWALPGATVLFGLVSLALLNAVRVWIGTVGREML